MDNLLHALIISLALVSCKSGVVKIVNQNGASITVNSEPYFHNNAYTFNNGITFNQVDSIIQNLNKKSKIKYRLPDYEEMELIEKQLGRYENQEGIIPEFFTSTKIIKGVFLPSHGSNDDGSGYGGDGHANQPEYYHRMYHKKRKTEKVDAYTKIMTGNFYLIIQQ